MRLIIRYSCLLFVLGTIASCKKYLDVNTNPNQPTKPTINGLLTRVTQNAALNVYRVSTGVTSYYVQYLSSSNAASPTDTYDDIDVSTTWTSLYDNMTDIYDLQKIAVERGAPHYQGVANILMAMDLSLVHMLWGDAPFTSAFSAESLSPEYDDAQSIYDKCLSLLDEAITLLGQAGGSVMIPTAGSNNPDLIHKGKITAWVKTAHAMKARLLLLVSETGEYNSAAILTELAAAYTSTADDAFITTFDVRNPWNQVALNNQNLLLDGWLSEQFIDAMNGDTYGIFDPRLPRLTDATKFGDYRGTPNGKGRTGSGVNFEETYVNLTGYYSSSNSPLFIITYEELKFIEAEVKFRASDLPGAYTAYLEGITASMNKIGVSPADRDDYITDASVSVGSANITMDLIMKEKYKALYLSPETWNDARRYNYQYEDFTLPLNAVTADYIRRLVYPSVETSRNGVNVPPVTGVLEKMWWDQRSEEHTSELQSPI
mgnify:CR=1 FL=1